MTIGAILTLGYGSFGSVNLLPTLGYGATESAVTVGAVPGFFKRTERTFLVEIDGNRFRVPESEIHRFIEDKQEEIVEQVLNKPVKKKAKKQKQEKIPQLSVQTDDGWLRGLIKEANRVVVERIKLQREADDEDDVESILLFM